MNPGRIESYVHSDSVTNNKAACLVRVQVDSEFAAKTDEFMAFCKKISMILCSVWVPLAIHSIQFEGMIIDEQNKYVTDDLDEGIIEEIELFGDFSEEVLAEKMALEQTLKEKILVTNITVMRL